MRVLIGIESRMKKEIYGGQITCCKCGQVCNHHLSKLLLRITIFFIPILSVTSNRYLVCDTCMSETEIVKKEYKELKKRQLQLLNRGEIPEEIIKTDFCPKNLKLYQKIFKLILSGILAVVMIFGGIGMAMEVTEKGDILGALFGFLYMGGFFSIPFILSLKNLKLALKKKKVYKNLLKKI